MCGQKRRGKARAFPLAAIVPSPATNYLRPPSAAHFSSIAVVTDFGRSMA